MRKHLLIMLFSGLLALPSAAQTLYQDAMALYEFRQLLAAFDKAHEGGQHHPLVPTENARLKDLDTDIQPCIRALANGGTAARKPFSNSFDEVASQPAAILLGDSLVRQQQAIAAFFLLEQYVRGDDKDPATCAITGKQASALTQAPLSLDFLPQINQQLRGGLMSAVPEALPTAGALSLLTGGIPEAAIIQGIVDWTVQRAKEELMRAFLQNWLAKLEREPVLQAAFPKSLDLLATTDLTTIISQGAVWKAAFEQDLQGIPAHLPAIVEAILARVPASRVDAQARVQLLGALRVASGLYVQLQQKQKLTTALLTTSNTLLQSGQASYSYAERGLFATQVLLNAVHVEQAGELKVLQPRAIQNLSPGQFDELWQLLVIQERPALLAITGLQDAALDARLAAIQSKARQALLDIAAAAGTLQQLRLEIGNDKTGSDEDRFQAATAYFGLVVTLLDEGLDFAGLFVEDAAVKQTLDEVIRPLGRDLAGIAEGISTKQYGLVVTNLIAAVRLIGAEVVSDQADRELLLAAADGIQLLQQLRMELRAQTPPADFAQDAETSLRAFADRIQGIDSVLATQLNTLADKAQNLVGKQVEDVKQALNQLLKDALKAVEDRIDQINLGTGLDEVAEHFNTYGRFMVNVLTAETSDDVKEAFEDAAMKTGSYMVKQTSRTSLTVTLLPGYSLGREWASQSTPQPTANAVSPTATYMGMSLPVGLEFSFLPSRFGTWGVNAQVLDLGAVMNFRLSQTPQADTVGVDTLTTTSIAPEIGFRQVLSPGIALLYHVPKAPIVIGARASYTPLLRDLQQNGSPVLQTNMWQVGGMIAVDVTAFQLFASRKKRNLDWKRIGE